MNDEYLKKIIREQGEPAECSLCQNDEEKAFTAEYLAELLDSIMREHFAQGAALKIKASHFFLAIGGFYPQFAESIVLCQFGKFYIFRAPKSATLVENTGI